jgi:hypothetical protein
MSQNEPETPRPIRKLTPLRRAILVVAAGVTLTAIGYTILPVAPRSVDFAVRLRSPALRERPSTLVISLEGRSVVEAETGPGAIEGEVLELNAWLTPERHRLEFRVQGCPPAIRTFDPGEQSLVAFEYRCDPGE